MPKAALELGAATVLLVASLASRVGGWFGLIGALLAAAIVLSIASLLVSLSTATKVNTFLEEHAHKTAKDG